MSVIEKCLVALRYTLPARLNTPPGFKWRSSTKRGVHARSAVGLAELPMRIPVEIEGEVEIDIDATGDKA